MNILERTRIRARDYILWFSGLNLGIAIVVWDEIYGAKTHYSWPNVNPLTFSIQNYYVTLPGYLSEEIVFFWVIVSVALLIIGLKTEKVIT